MTEEYRRELLQSYPDIQEIWLIGSRANGTAGVGSDWDYLVCGNPDIVDRLEADRNFHRADIDLLVVYNGDDFTGPWADSAGGKKTGSLREWKFKRCTATTASCEATKPKENRPSIRKAVRVWPEAGRGAIERMRGAPPVCE